MREWLRQLTLSREQSTEALTLPTALVWGQKAWNSLRKGREYDYSHEVFDAMAGCLACKACASQCPVHVDVPEFRSKFLHEYYGRYLRPIRD